MLYKDATTQNGHAIRVIRPLKLFFRRQIYCPTALRIAPLIAYTVPSAPIIVGV